MSDSPAALSSALAFRAFLLATLSLFASGVIAAGAIVSLVMQIGDERPTELAAPLTFLVISLVPIWIGVRASRRVRAHGTGGAFATLAKYSPVLCLLGALVGGVMTHRIYAGRGTPTVSSDDLLVYCEGYDARAACQRALADCQMNEFHLDRAAQARILECLTAAMAARDSDAE